MIRFVDQQNTPDAPLKIRVPGIYRLAVKEIIPNGKNYLYNLVDADCNQYTAVSKKSFRKNQLIRCTVQFTFINSEYQVSHVFICKRQGIEDKHPSPRTKPSAAERIISRAIISPGFIPTDYPFREGSPKQVNKTGSYRFTVDLWLPCPDGLPCKYVYLMQDCFNQKYHAISDIKYEKGDKVVCKVEVLKEGLNRKFFLTIAEDETSQAVCLINRKLFLRKDYTPHYPRVSSNESTISVEEQEPVYNKKATAIFDSLKASGFHKCGKDFVCSCCGKSYYKNQGIKSDTKEVFLCNNCREKARKRERKSRSVYVIYTPMGNKR